MTISQPSTDPPHADNPSTTSPKQLVGSGSPYHTGQKTSEGQPPFSPEAMKFISRPQHLAGDPTGASEAKNLNKAALTRLTLEELPAEKPDLFTSGVPKDQLIAEWLKSFITTGLNNGTLTEAHLLPTKGDLAGELGVSIGTVQNAIRFVEDEGHVESKQRIGTVICRPDGESRLRKQTSKRDQAVTAIRHLIIKEALAPGDPLPSAREISKTIGSAPNTTRLALEFLASQGVLRNYGFRGNKTNWYLQVVPTLEDSETANEKIESDTLIDQLERDLIQMITDNYTLGQKLPSHLDLADTFRVSIKTVHDAMRRLADQGIIQSKRGRYGTFVAAMPHTGTPVPLDTDLFVPAEAVAFYNYERVESFLRHMLGKELNVGDKLPSMGQLAEKLDVSSNTVRKALQNLANEGYIQFSRGRYGGTFMVKRPPMETTEGTPSSVNPLQWVSNPVRESQKTD